MTAILLSVRPRFSHAILDGSKTAEVRRRFPNQPEGAVVFVYSSTPDRAVLGTVQLDSIDRPRAGDVWGLYRDRIMIEEAPLNHYLDDLDAAAILHISDPRRWAASVPLSALRLEVGVEPPQSFRYLNDAQSQTLFELGAAAASRRLAAVG